VRPITGVRLIWTLNANDPCCMRLLYAPMTMLIIAE
jgi:hypothetical protein